MSSVAVIGGGVSGIAAAYYLLKNGYEVDLYETAHHLGGRMGSEEMNGRWFDFGGKNIGRKYTLLREFLREMGGNSFEYFGFNSSQVIGGRIVRFNKEKSRLFNLYKVISFSGLSGIARLYPCVSAVRKDYTQGALNTPFFNRIAAARDRQPLSAYFNRKCVNHVLRPITVRMNGAEPDECYFGNFGSNIALVLDSYEQLSGGMYGTVRRFSSFFPSLKVYAGHTVEAVSKEDVSGRLFIDYRHEGIHGRRSYKKVVSALPAVQLRSLIQPAFPDIANLLGQVVYYPVAVAIAQYRDQVFSDDQRAMVFDHSSPLSNAGAYGINDLNIVRYTFSGKTARSLIHEDALPEEVLSMGEKIIEPYFNIAKNSRSSFLYKHLAPGLCAYSPYHYRFLDKLDSLIQPVTGLYLTGDYRRGASLEACFRAAAETVDLLIQGDRS